MNCHFYLSLYCISLRLELCCTAVRRYCTILHNYMRKRALIVVIGGLSVIASALAAAPIAIITSSSSFELSGSSVNIGGVSSWPLVAGQEIVAGTSSLIIVFRDGSRITLAPGSRLKIDSSGSAVNLTGGSMQFSLASSSLLKIQNGGLPVGERTGSASRSGSLPSGGAFRPALAKLPAPPAPISSR
jgi:hypothetical protein